MCRGWTSVCRVGTSRVTRFQVEAEPQQGRLKLIGVLGERAVMFDYKMASGS